MTAMDLPAAAKDLVASQGWDDETVSNHLMSFLESHVEDHEDKIANHFEALGAKDLEQRAATDPAGLAKDRAEFDDDGFLSFETAEELFMIAHMEIAALGGHLLAIARQELGDIDDQLTSYLTTITADETSATAQPGL